ncbi:kinase binding protein [Phthorimaea operculella]|nr:kinase binding protein [Phthorimaea operculella]
MTCDPYTCDLDPDTKTKVKIYLFKNVENVEDIRNNVKSGAWSCAVIKPSLIVDPLQVVAAANRAAVARHQDNMVTRTVYGEILFNLSLSKNISQSLTKFGAENGKELLVCFLVTDEDSSSDILPQIKGEQCPLSELAAFTDLNDVKKTYKLNDIKGNVNYLDIIISRMVTKNFY